MNMQRGYAVKKTTVSAALIAAMTSFGVGLVNAQDKAMMETDWLELVKGYKGSGVGAEVREVDTNEDGGQSLVIAIPKASMPDYDAMEEVVVVGQAPGKIDFDLIPEFDYEWVEDYENDYYGLLIRLNEDSKVPIRLYMNSEDGFLR
ncbi:MAG: hypothetical protein ACJAYC_003841 [Halieaceae bacterium]|jgi:hypothetical protein